ncbi:MAG: ferritin-like domain-containing protein [Planctomycetes bacterium]|nr:ferritin-like domain-containing protein [Planctomycetota bacterium]
MSFRSTILTAFCLSAIVAVELPAQRNAACSGARLRARTGCVDPAPAAGATVSGNPSRCGPLHADRCTAPGGAMPCRANGTACATARREGVGAPAGRTTAGPVTAAYVERLQLALALESNARREYEAAAAAFAVPRFANLARAERRHEEAIRGLIATLGGTPQEATATFDRAVSDLADATARATAIESQVLAVYAGLIADSPDPAVTAVLERIQTANRRHLAAVRG